jgi:cell division protein FtsX
MTLACDARRSYLERLARSGRGDSVHLCPSIVIVIAVFVIAIGLDIDISTLISRSADIVIDSISISISLALSIAKNAKEEQRGADGPDRL